MSGICDTCSLSKGCRKPIGGVDSCRRYVRAKESNYQRLFGTPERAAQLISDNCEYLDYCGHCLIRAANCDGKYLTVLEWLRGDAE